VIASDQPVLGDFYADGCRACRAIAPTIEKLAEEYAGRVRVVKVNIEEAPTLAQRFEVTSIPTLAIFRNGEVVQQFVGAVGRDPLAAALDAQI
jgi:thioredoxin